MNLVGSNPVDVAPIEMVVPGEVLATNISKQCHALIHVDRVFMLGHLDQKIDFGLGRQTGYGRASDMMDDDQCI